MSDAAFALDALEPNRAGQLSAKQRTALEAAVRHNLDRVLGRALRRSYPLAKDLDADRVESIEGAVTKRIGSNWDYVLGSALANTQRGNEPMSYRISVASRQLGVQEFRSGRTYMTSHPTRGW